MRDFTVITEHPLPESFKKYKNYISLKYAIWSQIQEKLEDVKTHKLCPPDVDTTVAEINLGLISYNDLNKLKEINQLNQYIEYFNIKRHLEPDNDEWVTKIFKMSRKLKHLISEHER